VDRRFLISRDLWIMVASKLLSKWIWTDKMVISITINNSIIRDFQPVLAYHSPSKINIWEKRLPKSFKYLTQSKSPKKKKDKDSCKWRHNRIKWDKMIWMTLMKLRTLRCSLSKHLNNNNNNQLLMPRFKRINKFYKNNKLLAKKRKRRRKKLKIIFRFSKK